MIRVASRLIPVGILLVLAGTVSSQAQTISDDFNDGDDADWTRFEPLAPFGAGGTFSFPSGGYRIQAAASPNPAMLGPARAGVFRPDFSYTDFIVTADIVDWDDTLVQGFGVAARASDFGLGTTDGYIFVYSPASDFFTIGRLDNEGLSVADGCTCEPVALDPAKDYRFEFSGSGSNLAGRVFDLTDLSTPLVSITANDATYASGSSGLFVGASATGPADATFDNFVGARIPEPTTFALVALGGVFLACVARSRKSV